jgi:hypothetical protein
MTTNATAIPTQLDGTDESSPLTMILGYRSERFGYLRCVPCATGEGRHLFEQPIGLLHLFDGEETCCCCEVPLVPESLR